MDAIEALLILDDELLNGAPDHLSPESVARYGEMIVTGATHEEGYTSLV
jgi:hypothetical protein